MATRIGNALRRSLPFTHLAGRGRLAIWALASLVVLQVAQVQAAPPIESLQRSIQQRWEASNDNSQGLPTTFLPRKDGTIPDAMPQDGFYGSDLDDPDFLKTLVDEISGRVSALAGAYTWDGVKLDGNTSVLTLSPGGSWVVNFSSLKKVGSVLQVLPGDAPIDLRIAQCEEILRHCKNVPLRLTFNPVSAPTRNADGSWTPGSPGPALAYTKSVAAGVQPPGPGVAYGDASENWTFGAKIPEGDVIDRLDSGSLFSAASADTLQGTGIYPDPIEIQYLSGRMGQMCRYVGQDAYGTLKFYFSVDNNSQLPNPPVPPNPVLLPSINGPLFQWDAKTGNGNLVCREVGDDVPALVVSGSGGWNVRWAAGMFAGDFRDDWDPQCPACACTQGGVSGSGGTGGGLSGGSSGASGGGVSASAGASGMNFIMGLGGDTFGATAGSISLNSDLPIPDLINPNTFKYSVGPNGQVIRVNGVATQVVTPSSLVQVTALGPNKLTLKQYPAPTVPKQADGTYPVGGTPLKTVTIQKPVDPKTNRIDPNSVRITVENGPRLDVYTYQYTTATGAWKFSQGDGASTTYLTPIWNGAHTQRTEWRQVYNADGVLESESANVFQTEPWGEALAASIADPNGAALTTTYSYYEDSAQTGKYGQLKQMVDPNGYWETYDYDQYGRKVKVVGQFGDSAVASGDGSNRVITTTYANSNPAVTVVETLLGAETKRSYTAQFTNEARDIVCTVPGAGWSAVSNLVTVTKTVSGGPFSGQVQSVLRPDGVLTTYSYQLSPDGSTKTITTAIGQPNAGNDTVTAGRRMIKVLDRAGVEVSNTTVDVASGLALSTETRTAVDDLGRPTEFTYDDGTTRVTAIGCCGPLTQTDREGVTTTYGYDALGFVNATTKDGLTTLIDHDTLGRDVRVRRLGTDGSIQTLSETHYDLAGRIIQIAGVLGRSISISENYNNDGHLVRMISRADGNAESETFFKDGSVASRGGTAAHPLSYEYGVEDITPLGGTLIHARYTKEIRIGTGASVTEWTKTYRDMAGRVCKVLYANGGVLANVYNSLDQLVKTIDPDGVTTLYTYGGDGQPEITASDMDRNGVIDFAGSDRIKKTVRTVLVAHGLAVQRSVTFEWNQEGQDNSIVSSQIDMTPNGRHVWSTNYGLTTEIVIDLNGDGTVTTNATFPDGSMLVETRDHGRLTSSVRKDTTGAQVTGKTYTYDEPFRRLNQEIDARNGATIYRYYPDDQIQSITAPPPGDGSPAQITTFLYEAATGRKQQVQQPGGGTIGYEYWPAGELKRLFGSQTYPMEFTYDQQGRLKTLTSHGAAGAATTTWNYDAVSGFVSSKQYADGAGPTYTNTAAGRVASRTWARGAATSYARNNAGEISGVGYSDGVTQPVGLGYDRRGQLVTMVDASGTRTLVPAPDGKPGNELYSDGIFNGIAINRTYDTLLRPQSLTLAVGGQNITTSYGYDLTSRLATVTNGTMLATYSYVPNSSLIEQIVSGADGQAHMTAVRSFDLHDRLTSISSTIQGAAGAMSEFSYAYDSANQRVKSTAADGSRWEYSYDALGQVTGGSRRWADGKAVGDQQYSYSFDGIGNRTRTVVNGRSAVYTPNAINQYERRVVPGAVDVFGSAQVDAVVTVNGVVAARQGTYFSTTVSVDNSQTAAYPQIDVSATGPNGVTSSLDLISQKSGRTYLPATPEVFAYDADGNLSSDGRWIYTWDAENRLIAVEPNAISLAAGVPRNRLKFLYDANGRRVQKTLENWDTATSTYLVGAVSRFVYDQWNLLGELNSGNTPIRAYAWGADLSGGLQRAGGVAGLLFEMDFVKSQNYLPAYDGNGNVIALVNAADGTAAAQYEYGPFGENLRATGSAADSNPFRASTKYFDEETGLSYYGYRYYSPDTGRWLSRDPLADYSFFQTYATGLSGPIAAGLSKEALKMPYAMVANQPTMAVDLLGLRADPFIPAPKEYPATLIAFETGPSKSGLWPFHVYGGIRRAAAACSTSEPWNISGDCHVLSKESMRIYQCPCSAKVPFSAPDIAAILHRINMMNAMDYLTYTKNPLGPPINAPQTQKDYMRTFKATSLTSEDYPEIYSLFQQNIAQSLSEVLKGPVKSPYAYPACASFTLSLFDGLASCGLPSLDTFGKGYPEAGDPANTPFVLEQEMLKMHQCQLVINRLRPLP